MISCNLITVDPSDSDPLLDSADAPITADPCLFFFLDPAEFTEVPADGHMVPITAGVFVVTDENDEEGNAIYAPVEGGKVQLSATGQDGYLDDSTLQTDEDGLAQTRLTTGTTTGQQYTVTAKLLSYTYEGRERVFATGKEPTLSTATMQVIPGKPVEGVVTVGREDTPCDELSKVEVSVAGVKDLYGNTVQAVPIAARLIGSSGALIVENQGTVLSGMARLVLQSGSFPQTALLQTSCGTLGEEWFTETPVPFVDFSVTASAPASVPADSGLSRAIQISAPGVADGTPVYLYSTRGLLHNADTSIFNGTATITAQASGLPAGLSTIFGTVASKPVVLYGLMFEPDPELNLEVEERVLAGDLTEDGYVFIEQLDGPEDPPANGPEDSPALRRNAMAAAAAAPAMDGFIAVRAGTKVYIEGTPGHYLEIELRQLMQHQNLDFHLPPDFFTPYTPQGLPPGVASKVFRFYMPNHPVVVDIKSLGTWLTPTPRDQVVFSTVIIKDLTLDRQHPHQLIVGEAKLVASITNFLAGFFTGGGEGVAALIGDEVANTAPFVANIRDILIESYHLVCGDEVDSSRVVFSLVGIVLDFVPAVGEATGFCLGLIKRALKKFVKPRFRRAIMAIGKRVFRLIKELKNSKDALEEIESIANLLQALLSADQAQVEAFGESLGDSAEQVLLQAVLLSKKNDAFLQVFVDNMSRIDANRRFVATLGANPTMLAEAAELSEENLRHLVDVLEKCSDAAPQYFSKIVATQWAVGPKYPFARLIETAWVVRETAGLDKLLSLMSNSAKITAEGRRYELDVAADFVSNGQPIPRMGRAFPHGRSNSDLDLSNGIVVQVKMGSYNRSELESWFTDAKRYTGLPWTKLYYVTTISEDQLKGDKDFYRYLKTLKINIVTLPFDPSR